MVTRIPREPVTDALRDEWSTLEAVLVELSDDQLAAPSILDGWTVSDVFAHIAGTEWMLTGREVNSTRNVADLPHVRNPIGELNENWLDFYRARSRQELTDDFHDVTAQRLNALEGLTEQQWDAEAFTPVGPDSFGRFMRVRVFDSWTHEIDIRDSLNLGVPTDIVPATAARKEMVTNLPYLIGKRAAAPAGTTVTVDFTGLAPRAVHIAVDDRAAVVPAIDGPADVTLRVDLVDYARLIGGRTTADPSRVQIEGDTALGERIVGNLHYLI
ncbi:MAG: maleylpyruvate isomerase family mycothiol-dependent enzyme [Gordonia sp. (in: high G+C Gram-positive bacteria)]|uniref:maleylpyruvate isomerase family mycothiol-dependent enzyme n=1 Tax=Gordonia sp. (in: high G+C Gram-positive bacteria) TaxID=84139 RepID=UPI003BB54CF6